MSEDAHNSDNMTPEDFDRWRLKAHEEMLRASYLLRIFSPINRVESIIHHGRWKELTVDDFKFLHACGVSSE